MDVAASLTYSCRENRSIVSGRRLPDKNPTNQQVGKGRGPLLRTPAVLLGKGPEGEWVLVDKPTDLIIQRGCCEIMLFDLWEFQGRSMILLDIKTGAVKSFEVSMKSDCPVIVHLRYVSFNQNIMRVQHYSPHTVENQTIDHR